MLKERKVYSAEFRREAVRLAAEPDNKAREVERDLGLYQGAISRWKRELERDSHHAFPGKGHMKPLEEENRRLRRELERTQRERDILKKAAAYFSMDAVKDSRS